MTDSNFKIKVFNDINNEELKTSWMKLQETTQAFPQMYYEWVEPWVRLRFGNRKLRVVTVTLDETIIAIAPFCIEKKLSVNVLSSIPIHYGDKYEVLVSPDYDYKRIVHFILENIKKEKGFSVVKINQVESESNLFNALKSYDTENAVLINCPLSDFSDLTFDEYFMKLKRNVRSDFRRGKRRIEELGELQFEIHTSEAYYLQHERDFRALYEKRWKDIDEVLPDDDYYNCRRESFLGVLRRNDAIMVVLKIDDKIVGYRLGFLNNKCYYDWKICFDLEFSKYEISSVMTGELIKFLIEKGYNKINYGPGDYSYKRKWCLEAMAMQNHVFFIKKQGIKAKLYINSELKYKDQLKQVVSKLKGNGAKG